MHPQFTLTTQQSTHFTQKRCIEATDCDPLKTEAAQNCVFPLIRTSNNVDVPDGLQHIAIRLSRKQGNEIVHFQPIALWLCSKKVYACTIDFSRSTRPLRVKFHHTSALLLYFLHPNRCHPDAITCEWHMFNDLMHAWTGNESFNYLLWHKGWMWSLCESERN